jgi:hypothetical protein
MKLLRWCSAVSLLQVSMSCSSPSVAAPTFAGCTTAALKGTYGVQRNGQMKPGSSLTAVGIATFDGKGNLVEQQTMSVNGTFTSATNQSTYEIDADCTGTETDPSGVVVARLTMVHGGDEVLGMSFLPSSNVAVHYEKITGACTVATLNGVYGFQRNGTTSAGPLVAIGTATYDGHGNFVASQITDRNGTFGAPSNQTGTYAVNPDCTASASDTTQTVFSQMVIVSEAEEVLGMSMTAGNNVVVHFERVK